MAHSESVQGAASAAAVLSAVVGLDDETARFHGDVVLNSLNEAEARQERTGEAMGARKKNEEVDALPLGIGKPATRALDRAGYTRLTQLAQVTETELLQLHGVGPKAVGILRDALTAVGQSFMCSNTKSEPSDT